MDPPMTKNRLPILLNMSICDIVLRDQKTNNVSLINLFNQIVCGHLPFKHHRMHVYVALTEGLGNYLGELRLKHTSTDHAVLSVKGEIKMIDPLSVTEMDFELRNISFELAGKYHVELLLNGGIAGSRSFFVQQPAPTEQKKKEDEL